MRKYGWIVAAAWCVALAAGCGGEKAKSQGTPEVQSQASQQQVEQFKAMQKFSTDNAKEDQGDKGDSKQKK